MISRITCGGFSVAALLLLTPLAPAQEQDSQERLDEQEARIDELEEMLFEVDSRLGSRPPFLAFSGISADFGGHVTTMANHASGDDSSVTNMGALFVELYIKARIAEDWSIFATPGFYWVSDSKFADGANPTVPLNAETDVTVQRAYGEWHPSDKVNLKFGRYGTGHGVITREYFIPTRQISMSPLMTRIVGVDTLYPQLMDGASFEGAIPSGHNTFEYSAYLGASTFNTSELAVGGRLAYVFNDLGLSLAANAGQGHRTGIGELVPPPTQGGPPAGTPPILYNMPGFWSPYPVVSDSTNDYTFYGLDLDYRKGSWVVKGEIYASSEDDQPEDRLGYYFQPSYYITNKWAVVGRYDYFDIGGNRGEAKELVGGLVFDPNANVRFRFSAHQLDLPDTNTADDVMFASVGASFSF